MVNCKEVLKKILLSTDMKKVNITPFNGGCVAGIKEKEEFGIDLNEMNVQNMTIIKRPTRLEPEDAFLRVESIDGEVTYFVKYLGR